ncbi:hypothetical protein EV385_4546 [Krasilnikovia cinnamomea]|uniref:Uncharacterized protein n=1 Tax=Krasilnikovia cinnamomea TaxID=349313 RepID=A0A4Q7ZNP8_9ACTN|nr:hypothetical protein [Krasilnikovia cinnamomea]RZU52668.1 hypothetical protein EV385_4546 [Krasilnikovia cinnamomea]
MLTSAPGHNRADTIATVARCLDDDGPLVLLARDGNDDLYHRGPVPGGSIYLIPGLWSTMPPDLLRALRARRRADITGRCDACGAALTLSTGQMAHESDCNVGNDRLRPMLSAWLRRVGRYARGRRLTEDPLDPIDQATPTRQERRDVQQES